MLDQQHLGGILIVAASAAIIVAIILVFVGRRRAIRATAAAESRSALPKAANRFTGERVYSLALHGRHKFALRIMCYVAAAMPVPILVVVWYAAQRHPGTLPAISARFWLMVLAMLVWSAMTVWLLRTMVRHRQGTIVVLNPNGICYRAPKAGLFPPRDVFIPWEQIDRVEARNPHHPSLITVSSTAGEFAFDNQHAREVFPHPFRGEYLPRQSGNSLHRDLLEYSGPQPPVPAFRVTAPAGA